jgi:hypothetical protein
MFNLLTLGYLDPGAGSMLLQALIGGSAGLIVFVRHLFRNWKLSRGTAQTPVKRV